LIDLEILQLLEHFYLYSLPFSHLNLLKTGYIISFASYWSLADSFLQAAPLAARWLKMQTALFKKLR
jgi:hypothetical protein